MNTLAETAQLPTALGLLVMGGSALHVVGRQLSVRPAGRWTALAGTLIALAATGSALTQLTPATQAPVTWLAMASMTLVVNHRSGLAWSGRGAALALGVGALIMSGVGAALLAAPARVTLGGFAGNAPGLLTAQAALLAGGLALGVSGLLGASADHHLGRLARLSAGVLIAGLCVSLIAGLDLEASDALWRLPLRDASGAPASMTVEGAAGRRLDLPLTTAWQAPGLPGPWPLLALLIGALVSGAVGLLRPRAGAAGLALVGLGAAALGGWVALKMGAQAPLDAAQIEETLRLFNLDPARLAAQPALPEGPLYAHAADALPVAAALGLVGVVALGGGAALIPAPAPPVEWPADVHAREGQLTPGLHLLAARDATLMGAILLWGAGALAMLADLERFGRHVVDPGVGALLAAALLMSAATRAWHLAGRRGQLGALGGWLALLVAALLVAALMLTSGTPPPDPSHLVSMP